MEWKAIPGYEGCYEVSDCGDVKSIRKNGGLLKPWIDCWGYPNVCLHKDGKPNKKKVHRIVAETFLYPFSGEQVNHKDGNKMNNSVDNLEWCNGSENMNHAYRNGLHSKVKPVRIVELGMNFGSVSEAARYIGGNHVGIMRCLDGKRKTHRGYHFEPAEGE
jgi:hypothetical protein